MAFSILLGYATRYGSTKEAADVVAATLQEAGFQVDLQPAREVKSLVGYGAVVLGAPLQMYHWHEDVIRLLLRHQKAIQQVPVAVFALGPTTSPYDEKEWTSARQQLDGDLATMPWFSPLDVRIFGGRMDPAKLRFPMNLFSKAVPASDMLDLADVRAWAADLAGKLHPVSE